MLGRLFDRPRSFYPPDPVGMTTATLHFSGVPMTEGMPIAHNWEPVNNPVFARDCHGSLQCPQA